MPTATPPVCLRIETLRSDLFGDRGKSEMARRLDIRPSTYDRYERDRVPPADLLVRIADVCKVSLEWLITGEGPRHPERIADVEAEVLTRHFKELVVSRPGFRPIAKEFFSWVESLPLEPAGERPEPNSNENIRVPVIGVVNRQPDQQLLDNVARLADGRSVLWPEQGDTPLERDRAAATAWLSESDRTASAEVEVGPSKHIGQPVGQAVVLQAGPSDQLHSEDWVCFVVADELMAPAHPNGSYVIVDTAQTPEPGNTCVAKRSGSDQLFLRRYQPEHDDVLLVPDDLRGEVERFPASDLQVAWNVIGSVKLD